MLRYVLWVIRSMRKDLRLRNFYGIWQKTLVQFRALNGLLRRIFGPSQATLTQLEISEPISPELAELVAAAAARNSVHLKMLQSPSQALLVARWRWKLPSWIQLTQVVSVDVFATATGYTVSHESELRLGGRKLRTKLRTSSFRLPAKGRAIQLQFQSQSLLLRELARHGLLDFARYLEHFQQALTNADNPVVVYLPEVGLRNPQLGELGFIGFAGVTNPQGWIGCALSQSGLSQMALKQGLASLTIIEDDAELSTDWRKRWIAARKLVESDQLDAASGLISDLQQLPDNWKVLSGKSATFFVGPIFSSNVFTVLGPAILGWASNFPSGASNPNTEAFDRFLESKPGLRNGILVPSLVKHSDQASSTLWGFQNRTYANQIAAAEKLLADAVQSTQNDPLVGKLIE